MAYEISTHKSLFFKDVIYLNYQSILNSKLHFNLAYWFNYIIYIHLIKLMVLVYDFLFIISLLFVYLFLFQLIILTYIFYFVCILFFSSFNYVTTYNLSRINPLESTQLTILHCHITAEHPNLRENTFKTEKNSKNCTIIS